MKLAWTDIDGVKHEVSQEYATEVLQQLFEEWPGGIEEINSSIHTLSSGYHTYKAALKQVLSAVQAYLPPDGISKEEALTRIIAAVDPWPGE